MTPNPAEPRPEASHGRASQNAYSALELLIRLYRVLGHALWVGGVAFLVLFFVSIGDFPEQVRLVSTGAAVIICLGLVVSSLFHFASAEMTRLFINIDSRLEIIARSVSASEKQ